MSSIFNFMISIYATDIDDAVMAKAKKGVYEAAAPKGVEKKIIDKYFTYDGRYHVTTERLNVSYDSSTLTRSRGRTLHTSILYYV